MLHSIVAFICSIQLFLPYDALSCCFFIVINKCELEDLHDLLVVAKVHFVILCQV